jgi:putative ABC transport system permease protein
VIAKLVFENLKNRPMRTLLSVLLIGVPVTLILSLVGVSEGLSEDAKNRARGIGADIIIRPSSASVISSSSVAALDERIVPKIEKLPHVKLAIGVIVHSIDFPLTMMGVDMPAFNAMSGGFQYLAGGPLVGPDDVLLDQTYASQNGRRVGDTIPLLNHDWHVAGIMDGGKLAHVIVQKTTLQDLDGATGKITNIFVKLDDPARAEEEARHLRTILPNLKVDTMSFFTSTLSPSNFKQVKIFTYVVIGIGVVIGFAVVCLSMYMAVLQRTREIGILKSLGGSKGFILEMILAEAALLGICGTIFGIVLSYGACWAIRTFVPASFPMIIVPAWWPKAALITLLGTEFGALYPGFNAASHDPIEALAYE